MWRPPARIARRRFEDLKNRAQRRRELRRRDSEAGNGHVDNGIRRYSAVVAAQKSTGPRLLRAVLLAPANAQTPHLLRNLPALRH
jgi:hypothetical protein